MHQRLPIFPLATVLFPGLVLPLHVFEERYRQMVRDLVALPEEQRRFGVVALRQGRDVGEDAVASNSLYEIGCVAVLREVQELDDGRFVLVTAGSRRFRLGDLDDSRRYLRADVELLDEPVGDAAEVLVAAVGAAFTTYRRTLTGSTEELELLDDPELLSYVVAAAVVLDLSERQVLLEAPDTATRLRCELTLLRREIAMLNLLRSLPAVELPATQVSPN